MILFCTVQEIYFMHDLETCKKKCMTSSFNKVYNTCNGTLPVPGTVPYPVQFRYAIRYREVMGLEQFL